MNETVEQAEARHLAEFLAGAAEQANLDVDTARLPFAALMAKFLSPEFELGWLMQATFAALRECSDEDDAEDRATAAAEAGQDAYEVLRRALEMLQLERMTHG